MLCRITASTMTTAAPTTVASCTDRSTSGTAQTIAKVTTAIATASSGIKRSTASQTRSHAGLCSTLVCHTDAP